ncbi:hypothetical protein G4177_27010 [Corallococcus sp. ZKHCc1 1396]|uniref:Uncharacterized protein n=1 Tax=Corallococcus soli TaxID=2710757 RepID=A0ABR9PV80_9BACT|nr:hypothetical protein [Corallococcus soli]MBE4751825.1 hypothetical protein [Corallococcus soli]
MSTLVSRFQSMHQRAGTEVESPDGQFRVDRMEPSEYAVTARALGGPLFLLPRRMGLPANDQVTLDFVEGMGAASLRVRLYRLNLPGRLYNLGFALVPGTVSASAPPEELWTLTKHLSVPEVPELGLCGAGGATAWHPRMSVGCGRPPDPGKTKGADPRISPGFRAL